MASLKRTKYRLNQIKSTAYTNDSILSFIAYSIFYSIYKARPDLMVGAFSTAFRNPGFSIQGSGDNLDVSINSESLSGSLSSPKIRLNPISVLNNFKWASFIDFMTTAVGGHVMADFGRGGEIRTTSSLLDEYFYQTESMNPIFSVSGDVWFGTTSNLGFLALSDTLKLQNPIIVATETGDEGKIFSYEIRTWFNDQVYTSSLPTELDPMSLWAPMDISNTLPEIDSDMWVQITPAVGKDVNAIYPPYIIRIPMYQGAV